MNTLADFSTFLATTRAKRSSSTVAWGTTAPEWKLPPIAWPSKAGPRKRLGRKWRAMEENGSIAGSSPGLGTTKDNFPQELGTGLLSGEMRSAGDLPTPNA